MKHCCFTAPWAVQGPWAAQALCSLHAAEKPHAASLVQDPI